MLSKVMGYGAGVEIWTHPISYQLTTYNHNRQTTIYISNLYVVYNYVFTSVSK